MSRKRIFQSIANSGTQVRKQAAAVAVAANGQQGGDFQLQGQEAAPKSSQSSSPPFKRSKTKKPPASPQARTLGFNDGFPEPSQRGYFQRLTELDQLLRMWFNVRNAQSTMARYVRFNENRLKNLQIIQQRLRSDTFEFGPYQYFIVKEKTRRSIANAPLKDRAPHWLLYEHLLRHWRRRFIHDTFGNLPGKGTHAAVRRLSDWARKPALTHALQIDISKYFSSMQHAYLKKVLLQREGNTHIRTLINAVIDSFVTSNESDHLFAPGSSYLQTPEKGIALGNLSSQILANIYLNEFDHWVKEVLRIKHYIRYVDDIVVLGSSAQELAHLQQRLAAKLAEIGLQIHPRKTKIRKIGCGIPFLGYIVWPNHISAGQRVRNQYARKLRRINGKDNTAMRASYAGIFKHTGATR